LWYDKYAVKGRDVVRYEASIAHLHFAF
jgi:hypothetical protein